MYQKTIKTELTEYILDRINDYDKETIREMLENGELHNELFNTDYYIIGYYQCKQWLKKHNICPFDVCEYVKQYEVDNFGECNTDLSNPEKVVNMFVYIMGEVLLFDYDVIEMVEILVSDNPKEFVNLNTEKSKHDIFTISQIDSKESIDEDVKWVVNETLKQGKEKIEYNKLLEGKEKEEYIKKHFKQD
jgi:hypothetical protein